MELSDKTIVFVVSQLKVGGAAKMIKYVANLCAQFFNEVSLITYYNDFTPDDIDNRIKRYNLNVSFGGFPVWRLKALSRLRTILKKGNYDIVCSFLPDISTMSKLAAHGLNVKVVSCERGDPYEFSRLWRTIMSWTYSHSDYCVFQLEKARDFFGDDVIQHSFVIPNPYVPMGDITPFIGNRKKTIVSGGRFSLQKRFDVLIEAFAKVKKIHPDYKLVLYGEGDYLNNYKKQVKELGLEECVSFPGYVKNLAAQIREDGIFVLSSDFEGIPNALIEAMSVGIPVVATDCTPGGPAFLTQNGKRGLLVPVRDAEAMFLAILKLIENPLIAREMSEKEIAIVSELDINVINKQWIDFFKKIVIDKNGEKES